MLLNFDIYIFFSISHKFLPIHVHFHIISIHDFISLQKKKYSPRPVFPVDRPTDGRTEKRQTIAVTLRLHFAARVKYVHVI